MLVLQGMGSNLWDRLREGGQNEIGYGMVVGEVVDTDGVECHLVRRLDEGEVLIRSWMEGGGYEVGWNGVWGGV